MVKEEWRQIITEACKEAGTYRPYFDSVIDTLAGIMENRDDAQQKFDEGGRQTVTERTIRGGAVNIVKHPALAILDDLNKTALSYWRDLGLTPAGLKRINEDALKEKERSTFSEVLKGLGV